MSYVFLSHSSENNAQALALAQWLEGNGWADYFLDISDSRGLQAGSQWQNALRNASHRCEAVVFLISRPWNDSAWCRTEFLLAKQLGKQIFGVLIDDIRDLADQFKEQLDKKKRIALMNLDVIMKNYSKLLTHIEIAESELDETPKAKIEFLQTVVTLEKHFGFSIDVHTCSVAKYHSYIKQFNGGSS